MHIALYRPEIPPNTGNIARLSVALGASLHIVGKPGFSITSAAARRAGLDYWDDVRLHEHPDMDGFLTQVQGRPLRAVSKFGPVRYTDMSYSSDDVILFGNETIGFPPEVRQLLGRLDASIISIPMQAGCRSLNLSNAVAIVLYEAWRQQGFS